MRALETAGLAAVWLLQVVGVTAAIVVVVAYFVGMI